MLCSRGRCMPYEGIHCESRTNILACKDLDRLTSSRSAALQASLQYREAPKVLMCDGMAAASLASRRQPAFHLVAVRERLGAVILVECQLALQALAALTLQAPLLVHGALGVSVVYEVLVQAVALRCDRIQLQCSNTFS
jgi:hypothetical protein